MRHLFSLFVALAVTTGCGGDTGSGQGPSGVNPAGASGGGGTSGTGGAPNSGGTASAGASGLGGASVGGATGTQCKTTADCPQLGCYMCPGSICENGNCVTVGGPGNGGASGTGGTTGALKWYATCGPPVCNVPIPGAGGASSGVSACTSTETAGSECATADAECDTGAACSGPLKCASSDPTNGGQCPRSRAKYKKDIEYLTAADRSRLADDVQSIPLVRYRYKDGPERQHLGFIIEDVEPSPGVDSQHDQVDLYGYTSMAIAALQEQRHEIDDLKAEIRELRGELAKRKSAGSK